ncbi:hypothetical protein PUNSTDRAFT_76494 [Punctularia strigosozonata HHB-11173 SS5]|uniref:Glycoside hydrolase family 92 protein n=1 Tax=Punctularia strigosozonata (strain HHB-11173) TaxID=741275 RepID=R7S3B3_PUNST|nr:uncharacterized protein PUNSTDRAFT_76494 [Punctularia strigosozonata HHB-11173 SS5]EIN04267.1 hypothetical protein PUNSTDRAFT_76494 [Punctularia strigosozonata HHB-11173 SS5]
MPHRLIGNGGDSPNGSGGMIPSTAPPFAMTRWVAQTRQNYVSMTPYNYTDGTIHGFQGTHQPAIWMGESGQVVVVPGLGDVKSSFEDRGMAFRHEDEVITAHYYSVDLKADEGNVRAEMTATSRVGHLKFTFDSTSPPYILIEATRASIIGSADPSNVTYPLGEVSIDPSSREITGYNPERQDFIIGPNTETAKGFKGYFCARFSEPFSAWGITQNGTAREGATRDEGALLSAYAAFQDGTATVDVRVGVSFISVEQARRNLDNEISDETALEETARKTKDQWAEKLDRIKIEGGTQENKTVFYTAVYHSLQYPYEQSEEGRYYSGYDDSVHEGESYTGYSIWDTYRAIWAWQMLLAPERINGMVQSMLHDYKEGGWLPMWKNIVGTHADSLIAEAVLKGFKGFDLDLAWEAVLKDATVPPNVGYEVRAGLSSVYNTNGWIANDVHSESASRTLDYSYDDFAVATLASLLNRTDDADFFLNRSLTAPFTIFNSNTGFMEARNADGSWAGDEEGWTEGDKWAYTFDVVHDISALIDRLGGNESFVNFLDEHFDACPVSDGRSQPSHHIPYLYALAGDASKSQERVREVASSDYNATVNGLSGNEDCGQMSAWYIFSALGFYPVNPVSGEYVVGSPFFDKIVIDLPNADQPLTITADGAVTKPYVDGLEVNHVRVRQPILKHEQIARGGDVSFTMRNTPVRWH